MEPEGRLHRYSFSGTYFDLVSTVQSAITLVMANCSIIMGLRFVGSNSLQRSIDECRVVDLDVHILLRSLRFSDYLMILGGLEKSLEISLPETGIHIASVSSVHGLYKPAPLENGTRLLIHALIADSKRYLEIDSTLRYAWKKYRPSIGSFDEVDTLACRPTLREVLHGPEGVMFYLRCIRAGCSQLGIIREAQDHGVEEVTVQSREPSLLHELYTSSVVYKYRHLCRALGVLNERLNNVQLVKRKNLIWEDAHHILTPSETEALVLCVNSKDRLRNGSLEELSNPMIEMKRRASLAFFESVAGRLDD